MRASAPEALGALARDRVARQVMTAVLLWSGAPADGWLQAVEAVGGTELPDADRLAWAAHQRGPMETAARWLRRARKASPLASGVRAKRLLREAVRARLDAIPPGWDIVLIARRGIVGCRIQQVQAALDELLLRSNLIEGPQS